MSRFQGASRWVCICVRFHIPTLGWMRPSLVLKKEKEIQMTTLSMGLSFQNTSSFIASEAGDRDPQKDKQKSRVGISTREQW